LTLVIFSNRVRRINHRRADVALGVVVGTSSS